MVQSWWALWLFKRRKNIMFVLGLQGSPRVKGNTSSLVSAFLDMAGGLGARTLRVDVARKKISPCLECGTCEKDGFCPIDDDMQDMYVLLWEADIIVMATPVFFYGPTAQLKALIDRSQALWARRYVHNLSDPGRRWRQGCLLSVGATKGKNLFDGITLTARYFFDAVGARFEKSLGFRDVEGLGDIDGHPTALVEVKALAEDMMRPLIGRKRVLFVSPGDTVCLAQMACAFAQYQGGDRLDAQSAGSGKALEVHDAVHAVMKEKGLDMAFRKMLSLEAAGRPMRPDLVISAGSEKRWPQFRDADFMHWPLAVPTGQSMDAMRQLRDDIESRVDALVSSSGP
jgi:multimeric flavodoxin WrbA